MVDILIDFDGTLFKHKYPEIGEEVPFAFEYLKKFQELGCNLILWTMRGEKELKEAILACKERGIEFYSINKHPEQYKWTNSEKIDASICIDDRNAYSPLIKTEDRPYLDWSLVGDWVINRIHEKLNFIYQSKNKK